MVILTVAFTGLSVRILRAHKVNYMFIFDLDPHFRMTHMQLFKVSMQMLTILAFCFMGQVFIVKSYEDNALGIFPLIAFGLTLLLCI